LTYSTIATAFAASITFETPTATSTFGKGIDFRQPYTGSATFREVDIVITYPGSFGPSIVKLDRPGASAFTYLLDTSSGNMQPNTHLVARFQATLADGTVESGPEVQITYADDRFQWQTKVGKIVRLHWYQGSDAFAQQALRMGDEGIATAAAFMGFKETEPVDFFVYADQAPFYDALGPSTRDNVGGEANTETRTLFALIAPDELGYASSVVPHELTHVVFDDVTKNPYHFPPHWLNEGIAVYVSQGFVSSDKQLVSDAASGGTLMPLSAIRGQFPTTQERFFLAYAESVSAVDYFMRTYGHEDLGKLLKAFGTGASDDEAFKSAIGVGVDAFDLAWQKANGVTALRSFGPLPAPTGPVPPGWNGSGAGSSAPPGEAPGSSPAPNASSSPAPGSVGESQGGIPPLLIVAVGAVAIAMLVVVAVVVSRRASRRATP
jgi:hypothetical protein